MEKSQLKFLLLSICILLPSKTKGASGACTAKPMNIAVYEGDLNTTLYYPADPNGVQWTVTPTTDELSVNTITKYDGTVAANLAPDYEIGPFGLTIKNGTTTAKNGHLVSTSGLYFAQCINNGNSYGFKLLVVRKGPTCASNTKSSSKGVDLSCSVIYADSSYQPIAAVMTWFRNGKYISTETPQRTNLDPYVYIATSTIRVNNAIHATYVCVLTYDEPTEVQDENIATNAPEFIQSCSIQRTDP